MYGILELAVEAQLQSSFFRSFIRVTEVPINTSSRSWRCLRVWGRTLAISPQSLRPCFWVIKSKLFQQFAGNCVGLHTVLLFDLSAVPELAISNSPVNTDHRRKSE